MDILVDFNEMVGVDGYKRDRFHTVMIWQVGNLKSIAETSQHQLEMN